MSIFDWEFSRSRLERNNRAGWSGRIVCKVPRASFAYSLLPAKNSSFPDSEQGGESPVLVGWNTDKDFSPGIVLVELYYADPTWDHFLELHPNKAVLMSRVTVATETIKTLPVVQDFFTPSDFWANIPNLPNLPEQLMQGQEPKDKDGNSYWKIVSGPRVKNKARAELRVHAVVNNLWTWYYQFENKVGCVNATSMANMGSNQGKGHLLFTGITLAPRQAAGKLYTIDYFFISNVDEWTTLTVSQLYQYQAREVPLVDVNGVKSTTETRVVHKMVPQNAIRKGTGLLEANLSPIASLLENSW